MVSLRAKIFFKILKKVDPLSKEGMNTEQQRISMEEAVSIFKVPRGMKIEKLNVKGRNAEWIYGKKSKNTRIILYLHGGAYTRGSPKSHQALVARICKKTQAHALVLDYRLAPENPFPAAIEDVIDAYTWLLEEKEYNPQNVFIAGDSAGGGLTIATILKLREMGIKLPKAAICLSPWTDLELTGASYKKNEEKDIMLSLEEIKESANLYAGENEKTNPLISPIHADLSEFPPLFIQVGSFEMLYDDAIKLAENAKKVGVEVTLDVWEEMIHSFQILGRFIPESGKSIDRINEFISEQIHD